MARSGRGIQAVADVIIDFVVSVSIPVQAHKRRGLFARAANIADGIFVYRLESGLGGGLLGLVVSRLALSGAVPLPLVTAVTVAASVFPVASAASSAPIALLASRAFFFGAAVPFDFRLVVID
jgi:hypothetical protein